MNDVKPTPPRSAARVSARRRWRRSRWLLLPLPWLVLSLCVTALLVTALAVAIVPPIQAHLHEQRMLRQLESDDEVQRQVALQYMLRNLEDNEALARQVIQIMNRATEDDRFIELAQVLDHALLWRRDVVPPDTWLRWLKMLLDEPQDVRIFAAEQAATMWRQADNPALHELLRQLVKDDDPLVRYNAQAAVVELAGLAEDKQPYIETLRILADDDQPLIARDAWLVLALLAVEPQELTPLDPVVVYDSRDDDEVKQAVNYYLHGLGEPPELTPEQIEATRPPNEDELPAVLAAASPEWRDLACMVAVRTMSDDQLEEIIRDMLRSYHQARKVTGAMLAGMSGIEPMGIAGGLTRVLADHPELTEQQVRAMRDEQLAALGLQRVNMLRWYEQSERRWVVRQLLRLSLWMLGGEKELDEHIDILLYHESIPPSTVLLAMLHRGDARGLDFLLNPRGDPPVDLVAFLGGEETRWWHVLEAYLPDDAPRFWMGARQQVQQLQVDLLRNWFLLNRQRLLRYGLRSEP